MEEAVAPPKAMARAVGSCKRLKPAETPTPLAARTGRAASDTAATARRPFLYIPAIWLIVTAPLQMAQNDL